jgi:hypothetical protein
MAKPDLREYLAFTRWVAQFSYDDVKKQLVNRLDDSYVDFDGSYNVLISNTEQEFTTLPEALVHLWRNHSVDGVLAILHD